MPKIILSCFVVAALGAVVWSNFLSFALVQAQTPTSSANIVVDAEAQPTPAETLLDRVISSWPWYVTRASGLVAAMALIILMLSGIGFITGTTYRFIEPLTGWVTHRALGIILTVSLLIHVVALYFDRFVSFSITDLLIPFASQYQPAQILGFTLGSPYLAMGIVAFYLILLIVLVSILWVEGKTRSWKRIHLLSYPVAVLVFFHALMLGTDFRSGVPRYLLIILGGGVLLASLIRLWRAYTL